MRVWFAVFIAPIVCKTNWLPSVDELYPKIDAAVQRRLADPEIPWEELVPGKDQDLWTASNELRTDVQQFFSYIIDCKSIIFLFLLHLDITQYLLEKT